VKKPKKKKRRISIEPVARTPMGKKTKGFKVRIKFAYILIPLLLCGCGGKLTYNKYDIVDGKPVLVAREEVVVKGNIKAKSPSAEGESKSPVEVLKVIDKIEVEK